MKDFNTLILNGEKLNKTSLLERCSTKQIREAWEDDFWLFIEAWLNPLPYIEVKTSGSTGIPKLIQIDKVKMLASAQLTCTFFNLKAKDTALLCMSAKNIGGMMMIVRAFYAKLDLQLIKPQSNPLKTLNKSIDFCAMVPYQIHTSLTENPEQLYLIKHLLIGGGTVSSQLEEQIRSKGLKAYHSFGMTETISHFALRKIGFEDYFTCLPGITIEQASNDTLQVFAPIFEKTPIQTNDIIEKISTSTFRWKGRLDFAIETGGIKVLPEMIENMLAKQIDKRFFISALPDEKLNNRLILIIEGMPMQMPSNLFNGLPPYHKPKEVHFVLKFEETTSGKIDRLATHAKLNI